jgi:flavin reductase (DIM6/NTAB) family NADH-FMN oxidoreductase RutF
VNQIEELFRHLTLGVYVVGAAHNERRDAFTAAWVMQVSFNPLLVALSINPQNASYALVTESQAFTVNVLKRGQFELARRFGTRSGRDYNKLADLRWHPGRGGAPILDDALAYFDCDVTARHPAGDHELIVGRVVGGRITDPSAAPMMYRETGDMDQSADLYPKQF